MKTKKRRIYTTTTPSETQKLRNKYLKRGIELINITSLCELKIGNSGWCNTFNEPSEETYHIQIKYRDEWIGNFKGESTELEEGCFLFVEKDDCGDDFIIFKETNMR